jgi:Holliday junction DNA helicase RuvA
MIGRLMGHIVAQTLEGAAIIDVGGVGYEVLCPIGSVERASKDAQGRVTLFVHTAFRQDTIDLFAFATDHERRVFRMLTSVPNVGPKTAVALLGVLPPRQLAAAVRAGDLARFGKVPGVGKKIAERILLELKSKIAELQGADEPLPEADSPKPQLDSAARLAMALTSMGYKPSEAQAAVRALGDAVATQPVPELIREALAWLGR